MVGIKPGVPQGKDLRLHAGLGDIERFIGEQALLDEAGIVEEAFDAEIVRHDVQPDPVSRLQPADPCQSGDRHHLPAVQFLEALDGIRGMQEQRLGIVLQGGHDHGHRDFPTAQGVDGVGPVHGEMGPPLEHLLGRHGVGSPRKDFHRKPLLLVETPRQGLVETTVLRLGEPVRLQDNPVQRLSGGRWIRLLPPASGEEDKSTKEKNNPQLPQEWPHARI